MASQPEDDFVRPSASLEAEVRETEDDLVDNLLLHETLLESLHGTLQDTPEQNAELNSTIKSIKGKLRKLRNRRGKASSSVTSWMINPTTTTPMGNVDCPTHPIAFLCRFVFT
jgi:hypothetical protein